MSGKKIIVPIPINPEEPGKFSHADIQISQMDEPCCESERTKLM